MWSPGDVVFWGGMQAPPLDWAVDWHLLAGVRGIAGKPAYRWAAIDGIALAESSRLLTPEHCHDAGQVPNGW